jgi:hypothetical protein
MDVQEANLNGPSTVSNPTYQKESAVIMSLFSIVYNVLYCFHTAPSNSNHLVVNMGRYHFYDESPNVYSFTDEDLGLSTYEPDFDQSHWYLTSPST